MCDNNWNKKNNKRFFFYFQLEIMQECDKFFFLWIGGKVDCESMLGSWGFKGGFEKDTSKQRLRKRPSNFSPLSNPSPSKNSIEKEN
jgi:hypothetical protein